jgi:CofD-related protein of GAK system
LDEMVAGDEPQVRAIPEPLRSIVRRHIGFFRDAMPKSFDLRGAAIGNLVLAGGYLNQGRELDPVLYLFSRLVEVRGIVRPVVDADLHLVARLSDGRRIVGQHLLTGREAPPLDAPIDRVFLSRSRTNIREHRPRIPASVEELIRSADLICYPIGSYYTSLIATLLPQGVSDAIAATDVPKVYVPNPGHDPEEIGMGLVEKISRLRRYLSEGMSHSVTPDRLLQFVLLDGETKGLNRKSRQDIRRLGVEIVEVPLISAGSAPYLDDLLLAEALLSLV